jgi:thiamine-phosphate pyrophosphorylase
VTPRLVVVTPSGPFDVGIVRAAAEALPKGTLAVQLREKEDRDRRVHLAPILRDALRGQLLVINGDLELARDVGADGLHVPSAARAREILPEAWISVPAHDDEDVRRAANEGANAALVSPIFATPGKGPPRGLEAIRAARRLAPGLAIYALGGVSLANAEACCSAGATGVAVIRAFFGAADPVAAARALTGG